LVEEHIAACGTFIQGYIRRSMTPINSEGIDYRPAAVASVSETLPSIKPGENF